MTVTMTMVEYEELKRWREIFLDFYREMDRSVHRDEFAYKLRVDEHTYMDAMEKFHPNKLVEF